MANPVQYIIADANLRMSPGKLAAQVAHASVEGVRISAKTEGGNPWDSSIVNLWYRGGHYTKIVLQADDLAVAERYIRDRGFKTALIIDEGRTEFNGRLTPTAIGVEILDKDSQHVRDTFGEFELYRNRPDGVVVVEAFRKLKMEEANCIKELWRDGASPEVVRRYLRSIDDHEQRPKRRWFSRKPETLESKRKRAIKVPAAEGYVKRP